MTVEGHRRLQADLHRLKTEERQKCVKAIEEARAHGDLSENAEYDAAKNAQGLLEAKIRDMESKLASAQVIDTSTLQGDRVVFGASVSLSDLDSGEERHVTIVGEEETDVQNGLISYSSPLARSLIGKRVGDTARVRLPAGEKEYEILGVEFSKS